MQLGGIFQYLPVGMFYEQQLMVPLWQIIFYTIIITFCLLLRRYRLGLSVSFIFCFYWGFIANQSLFIKSWDSINRFSWVFIFYVASGFIVITLSIVSFFLSD